MFTIITVIIKYLSIYTFFFLLLMSKWRNNIKPVVFFFKFFMCIINCLEDLSMAVCSWIYTVLLNSSLLFHCTDIFWWFKSGFLIPGTTGTLSCIILCCGGCAVHYRMLSHNLDLSPLNASSCPHCRCDNHKCFQILPNVFLNYKITTGWEPLI